MICLATQLVRASPEMVKVAHEEGVLQNTITGTVTDDNGAPLPGASILVKGTTTGTQTDFDGNYSISAESGATLVFSYVGFATQEIVVGAQNSIDVSMAEDAAALEEVVVVGYGTQRKQDLTGAISVVKTDEMVQQPSGQITNQLQGRVSGVTITGGGQPGEAPQIKIRGANTFGNNSPLYVV
ncbi:MAG: hypothetical protein CL868_00635, partial [Cytophagaceae bacterium]|nr:hypothetical protein [Cytophagaceae bacterium]